MGSELATISQVGERGIQIGNVTELLTMARQVHESGLFPQFKTPAATAMAIETALELGLKPMLSLPKMTVINGKVGLMGDLALGIVRSSKVCEYVKDGLGGTEGKDDRHAWVESKRKDTGEIKRTSFSVSDARRAGLWGKSGPWSQYPQRMLYYRALAFNLRDAFPDVLMGQSVAEELEDYQPVRKVESMVVGAPTDTKPDPVITAISSTPAEPEGPDPDIIGPSIGENPNPDEGKPDAGDMDLPAWEKCVISASERWGCDFDVAKARIERFTKPVMRKKLESLDERQIADINRKVSSGELSLEVAT